MIQGPDYEEVVHGYFKVTQNLETGTGYLYHIPSGTLMKRWVDPFNSPLAFDNLKEYADNVSKMNLDWEDPDFKNLLPFENFESEYLDPVGFGHETPENVTAKVMERLMKYQNQLGGNEC